MRALCVVLLLLPGVTSAQARLASADSARVEVLVDALQIDRQLQSSLSRIAGRAEWAEVRAAITAQAVRAAVRERLVASYADDRADAAARALATGHMGAFLERLLAIQAPDLQARVVGVLLDPPKKGTLGDSAEAVRFVRASGVTDFSRQTLRDLLQGLLDRVPAARDELAREGRTLDEIVEEQTEMLESVFVTAARLSPSDPAALAVAESDAGRWMTGALFDGIRAVYVGPLIDVFVRTTSEPLPR